MTAPRESDGEGGFVFSSEEWINALEKHEDHLPEAAWLVAGAVATLADEDGSVTAAEVVSDIERSPEYHDNKLAAGTIFAVGCRALEDVHLLHDFGSRLVAVLPQTHQEA